MKKAKIRNPWIVLLLSVITGGIYLLYWLIINPIEIKKAFHFEEGENQIKLTFTFLILFITLAAAFTVYTIVLSITMRLDDIYFTSTIYSLVMVFVGGSFFLFFCKSVHLAQRKVKIEPFEFLTIFGVYLLNVLIETGTELKILSSKYFKDLPETVETHSPNDLKQLTELIPILNTSGVLNILSMILFFFFIFLLQRQINRIWEEGDWEGSIDQNT